MQYSRVLARWLKTSGLSPAEAAPILGVSFQTVYRWLDAEAFPPRTRIPWIAQTIGVAEAKLRQIVEKERPPRKHRGKRGASATTATVDETAATGVAL